MEFTNKEFKERINFAAYKTSLRGEHVLGDDYCRMYSDYGSKIHDALLDAGLKRKVRIRMIENYPPKDKGDNEDGINFAKTESLSTACKKIRSLNSSGRIWNLVAILDAVEKAKKFLFIEVMDYFLMFIYNISRNLEVKILTSTIHFPEYSLRFLSSLEVLNKINDSSIELEIFKVPADFDMQHIMKRERQMHTKFLVTDTVGIAGTSNWAGDYFDGGITGAAFILNQTEVPLERRHFVRDLRCTFLSHWLSFTCFDYIILIASLLFSKISSDYTHNILDYERECLRTKTGNYCETEKDSSLLAAQYFSVNIFPRNIQALIFISMLRLKSGYSNLIFGTLLQNSK
ncbi:unnamed protein product [Onchocerca flexuosa]|uniref:PLD phosphodiesterase domain-containing protein n=1 Tax=Onchocerca flexuosa TaxID=387005 RepID=A0A183H0C6_9BILA|nr:unnamed protein product [Onchocerca flexuosa]